MSFCVSAITFVCLKFSDSFSFSILSNIGVFIFTSYYSFSFSAVNLAVALEFEGEEMLMLKAPESDYFFVI